MIGSIVFRSGLLAFAVVSSACVSPVLAQSALFTSAAGLDLTPVQQRAIGALSAQPTAASLQIVRVDADALLGEAVTLSLPGAGAARADRRKTLARSASDYSWSGDLAGSGGRADLVVRNGQITGMIQSLKYQYTIVPVGGGAHALIKIDQSKFPPDHPPGPPMRPPAMTPSSPIPGAPAVSLPKAQIDKAAEAKRAQAAASGAAADAGVEIDVLVSWTEDARNAYGGDMQALAQLSVDVANATYVNSGVPGVTLRLVGTREVPFPEEGKDFGTILYNLAFGADPAMLAVRTQRERNGADLVAILIARNDYCGMAYLPASESSAFAVVNWSCSVGYHTFSHELGHLFGANHDPFVDTGSWPYAYGHGYINSKKTYHTSLAYQNGCGSCPRIGYLSNPDVMYEGEPMGTAAVSDNARVHRERAATLAAFRATVPAPPANDFFATAIPLPASASGATTGSNVSAANENGEPVHAGNAGGASVWWTFTPTASGTYTFDTTGSAFRTLVAVYTGSSLKALTSVAQNGDPSGPANSVTFQATGGVTYRIAVDGYNAGGGPASGAIALKWTGNLRKGRDFNADGRADILWRDSTNGNVVISMMDGASIVSSTLVAKPPLSWSVAGIGDFNADGKADVLWRDSTNGNVVMTRMNGTTIAASPFVTTLPLTWSIAGIGDFNGDGRADILWRDTTNGNLVLSLVNGTNISSSRLIANLPLTWSVAGVGDFNGDGRADILWRDSATGAVVLSIMNNATIVSSTFVATLPSTWNVAGVGDFDGDDKADILWRDSGAGNAVVSLMNNATIVSSILVASLPMSWTVAALGDFNGDGKADVLWRDTSNGNVVVSLMNGAAISSSSFVVNLPLAWSVQGFNVN